MIPIELPAPKFGHFERVVVRSDAPRCKRLSGEQGTIIWLDSSYVIRNPNLADQWLYIVHLPNRAAWYTFFQSDLESQGDFDPVMAHLGNRPEVSFDTVLADDNECIEGSYRLPGELWKVVIFQKDDVPGVQVRPSNWQRPTKWERKATGAVIRFPRSGKMGRADLLRAMTTAFGFGEWVEVNGPDSIVLR